MYPVENDDITKRVNIFSTFMLQMLQNLCLILLWAKFASNWTNIKNKLEKVFQWLSPT